jgi:hypothetical protein
MKCHFNIDGDVERLSQRGRYVRWHIFVLFHDACECTIFFDKAITTELSYSLCLLALAYHRAKREIKQK